MLALQIAGLGRARAEPASATDEATATQSVAELDWVPKRLLAADADTGHCGGLYESPISDSPEAEQQPAESPIRSSALESEIRNNTMAVFKGDVVIEEGYRRLTADEASYNRETEELTLTGSLLLREPGMAIRADKATLNAADGTGSLSPADYVLHKQHVRGGADRIERKKDGRLELSGASYTHCEPKNNAWLLQGSKIIIDQESGIGTARHARLEIKGVPVFYSPWLQFPIDDRRKTGLLWPSYSNTSTGGIDIAIPYYINLAPNYDLTITPRYISNRGVIAETEARWLTSFGSWVASASYLADEEGTNRDRWLVALKEQGEIGSKIRTNIDFTRVSDEDFFNDLSTRGLEVKRKTHLDQLASLNYVNASWDISARLQQFQTIQESITEANKPYKLLPQVSANTSSLALPFHLQYSFRSQYTYFDHPTRDRGHRLYLEPGISYPMEWLAGYIKPAIKLKHASYSLERTRNEELGDSEEYTVPVFKLDTGLFFERDMSINDSKYIQTLEPRLFYLNVPEQDQVDIPTFDTTPLTFGYSQLFREDRFTGRDRVGDANQLTVGLTTRFIDHEGGEKLSASVGQIFYFEDRIVSASGNPRPEDGDATSAVAGELEYRPTDHLRFTSSILWETADDKIDQGSLQLQYEPEEDVLINVAYRYRRDNPLFREGDDTFGETIEQTDVSAVFPFGKHWRAYLRWQYDLVQESTIEDLVGLEYSNCCWDVRVVYQRGLNGALNPDANLDGEFDTQREHAVYLQFVLRGLGSLGDKIDRILDRSILGYSDFSKNFR